MKRKMEPLESIQTLAFGAAQPASLEDDAIVLTFPHPSYPDAFIASLFKMDILTPGQQDDIKRVSTPPTETLRIPRKILNPIKIDLALKICEKNYEDMKEVAQAIANFGCSCSMVRENGFCLLALDPYEAEYYMEMLSNLTNNKILFLRNDNAIQACIPLGLIDVEQMAKLRKGLGFWMNFPKDDQENSKPGATP